MLASGTDPYPVGYPRTTTAAALRERYPDLPKDTATGEIVGVAGRVMLSRIGGKICFATLRDGTGDIQAMIRLDEVPLIDAHEPWLTLIGLRLVWERNTSRETNVLPGADHR